MDKHQIAYFLGLTILLSGLGYSIYQNKERTIHIAMLVALFMIMYNYSYQNGYISV